MEVDSGYEMSALIVALPKNAVKIFLDEFSKYVLQKDEFSLGPVFIEHRATVLNARSQIHRLERRRCSQK